MVSDNTINHWLHIVQVQNGINPNDKMILSIHLISKQVTTYISLTNIHSIAKTIKSQELDIRLYKGKNFSMT